MAFVNGVASRAAAGRDAHSGRGRGAAASAAVKPLLRRTVWREIYALLAARSGRLSLGLTLILVNRAAGLVLPGLSKFLIDNVVREQRADLLLRLAGVAAAATILQACTAFALSQVLGVAAQRSINQMRRRVLAHVSRLPVSYFDANQSGVLVARIMQDAEALRNLLGGGLVDFLGSILTAAAALGVLFYLNWHLTLVTFSALGAFGLSLMFALRRLRPIFRERARINAEVGGRLNETLGGIRVVKTYAAEKREQIVFTRGVNRLFRCVATSITGASALAASSSIVGGAIGIALMVMGGRAILSGRMTLGDLVLYLMLTAITAAPVSRIASIGPQMLEAIAGLDRIREVLGLATEDAADAGKAPLGRLDGEIVVDRACFAYIPGVPVLKDVSFHAAPGTTTALVGPSGSGKSTLAGLVMAFHQPTAGEIRVDGRPLDTVPLQEYRQQLGVVLQDNFLFDGTVADNIRYARTNAPMTAVRAAGQLAHAEEFISRLPKGYDTVIGERGVRLSGGQRQRLAIARAILADPRILVLDEATSSLDSESEAMIQRGLQSLRRGRTTLVIAHRLSTIRSADQILVLDGGEIVERGTHTELLARGGRYRALYDRQYALETDRFVNEGEDPTPAPRAARGLAVAGQADSALS